MHLAMPTQVCVVQTCGETTCVTFRGEVASIFDTDVEAAVDAALPWWPEHSAPPTTICSSLTIPGRGSKLSARLLKISFGLSLLAGASFSASSNDSDDDVLYAAQEVIRGGRTTIHSFRKLSDYAPVWLRSDKERPPDGNSGLLRGSRLPALPMQSRSKRPPARLEKASSDATVAEKTQAGERGVRNFVRSAESGAMTHHWRPLRPLHGN